MNGLIALLLQVQLHPLYTIALAYFACYPIITSLMWTITTQFFRWRWERENTVPALPNSPPMFSILIPAYNESEGIVPALEAACAIDYPAYEIVVVNDGSSDDTCARVMPFVERGLVRLVDKRVNEGKAMALNDALPVLRGDLVLIIDADARPDADILKYLAPHFAWGRVGAVTGNPRVRNVDNFLTRLQLIEFTSIVSLLRRSQRIWGRIQTMSGVVSAFRRSALIDVGGFSPDMATEDIELTWKLQRRFWDVRYEPRALVWMTVPRTWGSLWRQRLRWARGLMQVLHKHRGVLAGWKYRRMWPVTIESLLSILWAICFVGFTALWLLCYAVGLPPIGADPIPNLWGMSIATICLLQLAVGVITDQKYDAGTRRYFAYAVYYPLIYWAFLALCTVVALPHLWRTPKAAPARWHTRRDNASGEGA